MFAMFFLMPLWHYFLTSYRSFSSGSAPAKQEKLVIHRAIGPPKFGYDVIERKSFVRTDTWGVGEEGAAQCHLRFQVFLIPTEATLTSKLN